MGQQVFQDFGFSLNSITFLKCESDVLAIRRLFYKDKNKHLASVKGTEKVLLQISEKHP